MDVFAILKQSRTMMTMSHTLLWQDTSNYSHTMP